MPRHAPATARAALCALSTLCAATLVTGTADAHGGFWRAYDILVQPDDPDHIVMRSDVWALIETHDGGETWQWLCAELYGGMSGNPERRPMVLLPGGDLLVASGFAGLRSRGSDACAEWQAVGPFEELVVQDVTPIEPGGAHVAILVSQSDGMGSIVTRVFESPDGGGTFAQLGVELPPDFSGTSLRVASSDPSRMYVAGKVIGDTTAGVVARTDDAGASWQLLQVPIDAEAWGARLLGVDPARPDVVYFWQDAIEAGGGDVQPDTIWLSTSAGESWDVLYAGVGNLPGFALSPDGATLMLSGPEDGLWAADVGALLAGGGSALSQVNTSRIWGVQWRQGALLAGGNDFTRPGVVPFSLGVSTDGGETFEPFFEICDTELISCESGSFGARVCPVKFSDPDGEGNFKEDFLDSERCASGPGVDAGAEPPVDAGPGDLVVQGTHHSSKADGCGCTLPGGGRSRAGAWWLAGLAALLGGLRRRRVELR